MKIQCNICPHHCNLEQGQVGICHGRIHRGNEIVSENYGKLTALALDPIEKKPLYHFYPGSKILSIGSYGCNLRCPFCQNCDISMAGAGQIDVAVMRKEEIAEKALQLKRAGNIGIAFTYNEPLIGYEFVRDLAALIKQCNLKTVVVTNGYICEEPFRELLPLIDAFNIDLKGFTESYYQKLRGDLACVKRSIEIAAERCHVEVTTLIVPGENDSEQEMEALSGWLAGISPDIPLHISRFFPRWKMQDKPVTPVQKIYRLAEVARQNLKYVHEGNV
ncbi:MAG TPA: AmmeMemoRadiSam system radical SAM enzyme [Lachnospiraceae bacterium]|nr:AmmeMemoRadiSam system radical SAM enzyme [Lachnospiraceae bacterium]HBY71195.1 AmmeMemoRadiSam system radical SAM enzyme [Lachnospiraceae bacterium]HCA69258.1 AmmeMemoRadiSam system radical SAM enzyme [Lachnospiraceae bacterium]HCR39260.1 AmmeMemoRadiSam system radical SAM enzyme [Lachnospiraceae bacterium]